MKAISLLTFLVISCVTSAQETYYHEFDLFPLEYNWMFSLHVDGEDIYLSGDALCIEESDTTNCLGVIKVDSDRNIKWAKTFPGYRHGNKDCIDTSDDHLYISGADGLKYNLLKLDHDGVLINSFVFDFGAVTFEGQANFMNNNGLRLIGDSLYSWGETGDTLIDYGYLLKVSANTLILEQIDYYNSGPDGEARGHWNMKLKNDSTLIMGNSVNHYGDELEDIYSQHYFTQLSTDGETKHTTFGPTESPANEILPNFTYHDGRINFVYTVRGFQFFNHPSIYSMDEFGDVKWEYDFYQEMGLAYTDQETRSISIFDLITTKNGDVVGTGSIRRYDEVLSTFFRNAYIFRLSKDGNLIWHQQFYKFDEQNELNNTLSPSSVREMDDGRILAMGKRGGTGSSFLLMVDGETGCVEGYPCDGDILLSTHDSDTEHTFALYPNPASRALRIETINEWSSLTINTVMGQVVMSNDYTFDQTLDISSLSPGIYILSLVDEDGNVAAKKFVKN